MTMPQQTSPNTRRYSLKSVLVVAAITIALLLVANYINKARHESADFQRSLDEITD